MLIATVERVVGRSEVFLPLTSVECLSVLVVIADDGEEAHLR